MGLQDINLLAPDCESTPMVNLWIPLIDTEERSGCLRVARRSHTRGILPYDSGEIPDSALQGLERVTCPTPAGGAVFLTQMLAHGSHDHLAEGLVRWSLDIRYSVLDMPTGRDEVPGFVARSRRSPERVTKDAAAWRAAVEAVPGAEEVANGVAAREMVRQQRL